MATPGDLPDEFTGPVKLFPLPNMVMFPHVLQQLHLFEPRYVRMLEDALEADSLIAMALLAKGWEETPDDTPAIHDMVCLGRVVTHAALPSKRYNIILQGLRRARIVRELPGEHLYREAEVQLMPDVLGHHVEPQGILFEPLMKQFRRMTSDSASDEPDQPSSADPDLTLGQLTDILAYSLDLKIGVKQRLLEQTDVAERARLLIELLSQGDDRPSGSGFPPEFSEN